MWVGLVALAVLSTGHHCSRTEAGNRKLLSKFVEVRADRPAEREEDIVKGYGVDAAKARERALEKAQDRVREQLAEKLGTSWRPGDEVLDPEFLTRFEVVRNLGEPVEQMIDGEPRIVAQYHVRVNRPYLHEVARAVRHQQMSDRHLIAGRVLIGLLAVLLVTTGYLRLEDLTRGYATTLLRVGAVVILLVVGFALSWPYVYYWG